VSSLPRPRDHPNDELPSLPKQEDQLKPEMPPLHRPDDQPKLGMPPLPRLEDQPKPEMPLLPRPKDQPKPEMPSLPKPEDQPKHKMLPLPKPKDQPKPNIGVNLGGKLNRIHPDMIAFNKDNKGGCVIDLSTPLTAMVHEAYTTIKEVVWSDLEHHKMKKVTHPRFRLYFRAAEAKKMHLQSLSLRFAVEEEVLTLSLQQLFLMMHDKEGQIVCLTMTLGHQTINSAVQLIDTRFIYDVKESKL
jgi:hypothetical protein